MHLNLQSLCRYKSHCSVCLWFCRVFLSYIDWFYSYFSLLNSLLFTCTLHTKSCQTIERRMNICERPNNRIAVFQKPWVMSNEQDYPNNENAVLDVANVHDQSAVRSFIGQGPHHPAAALPLSARTNSDLIHCSSQNSSLIGRTATQFQASWANLKIFLVFCKTSIFL